MQVIFEAVGNSLENIFIIILVSPRKLWGYLAIAYILHQFRYTCMCPCFSLQSNGPMHRFYPWEAGQD